MSTKYKYREDGSYFDPETKRTYYKDPQYQKAYDDEWNRLEKLYKMKQEEQKRIERENFQRVLAQADALTKSMQALGYRVPLPWEQKNRFDGTEESEIERNVELPEITVYPNNYYYHPRYNSKTKELGYQRGQDFTTERPQRHLIREFEYTPTYPIEKPLQLWYPEFDALLGIRGGALKSLNTLSKHLKTIFKPKHRDYLKRVLKEGFDELVIKNIIEDKVIDKITDE